MAIVSLAIEISVEDLLDEDELDSLFFFSFFLFFLEEVLMGVDSFTTVQSVSSFLRHCFFSFCVSLSTSDPHVINSANALISPLTDNLSSLTTSLAISAQHGRG